jgi:hypothetical protein
MNAFPLYALSTECVGRMYNVGAVFVRLHFYSLTPLNGFRLHFTGIKIHTGPLTLPLLEDSEFIFEKNYKSLLLIWNIISFLRIFKSDKEVNAYRAYNTHKLSP